MTSIVFYFQVHQPYRLRRFRPKDVNSGAEWFDDGLNADIVRRVAERCYVPMNELFLQLIEETDQRFRISYSVSGTALRQMEDWAPEALDSFVALADTGCAEFLCETSHHSLAFLSAPDEFALQVEDQRERIQRLFGAQPKTFRNTELVFDESIARQVEELGFETLLGEGADRLLNGRSPRHAYRVAGCSRLKLLLRDYPFSDDIAFRFSNREWPEYPLFADRFAGWLHAVPAADEFVGLFMDYETFGEHQSKDTGIIEFMRHLPAHVLEHERFDFRTPAEVAAMLDPVETLAVPDPVSWADAERDLSAWLSNPMQQEAHAALYALGPRVRRAVDAGHPEFLDAWRKLSTSDHVYYMCTKFLSDQDVHEYFSPYDRPHEAFVTFMNVLADLDQKLTDLDRPASKRVSTTPSRPRKTK